MPVGSFTEVNEHSVTATCRMMQIFGIGNMAKGWKPDCQAIKGNYEEQQWPHMVRKNRLFCKENGGC